MVIYKEMDFVITIDNNWVEHENLNEHMGWKTFMIHPDSLIWDARFQNKQINKYPVMRRKYKNNRATSLMYIRIKQTCGMYQANMWTWYRFR